MNRNLILTLKEKALSVAIKMREKSKKDIF